MNQIWPRVLRLCHRTSVHSRRSLSAFAEYVTASAATNSRPLRPTQLVSRLYQPSNLRDVGQDVRGEMTCKSQKLMLQAGLIYPSNPGCYYYLPATVRSMEKLVGFVFVWGGGSFFNSYKIDVIYNCCLQMRVIDQEMQAIGGQKLDMPSLCSAELWKASDRWELMGKELLRLRDRHGGDYCLAPTHEEAVTTLVAHQSSLSYRQLPLLLYQVGNLNLKNS